MAGFFKKLIDQVKKECSDVGGLIESIKESGVKQYVGEQEAELDDIETSSSPKTYGQCIVEENQERARRQQDRAERLKTVYRDPSDVEMAAEARSQINARIKDNLRPRNFLWGSKDALDEIADYVVDNCEKDLDEICAYVESKGIRYDRAKMEEEINYFIRDSFFYLYRRNRIEEYIFLDRMTTEDIMELIEADIRQMEEMRNRQ